MLFLFQNSIFKVYTLYNSEGIVILLLCSNIYLSKKNMMKLHKFYNKMFCNMYNVINIQNI